MVVKQISKLLVVVMVVILFVMGLQVGVVKAVASVPDSPAFIAFQDGGAQSNQYIGTVTIGKAADESNIEGYRLYWASDTSIISQVNLFDVIAVTYANIDYSLNEYGATGSTRLAVVSYSSGNESAPVFIPLIDNISSNITPSPSPTYNSLSVQNLPVDRAGTAYMEVVRWDAAPVTYGQLIAGGNATSISQIVTTPGTISVSIPGLADNTFYTLYMVVVNSSGLHSSIKTFGFKTLVQLNVNGDDAVGIDDIVNIMNGNSPSKDINNDGTFDLTDINILLNHITPRVALDPISV
jgi:hypothetical protein